MRVPTRLVPLALIGAAVLALTACGGNKNETIVLYNGQHPELTTALVAAFEKDTGIKVEERSNDTVVLANQILQEGKNSPADVYLSENSPELMTLEQHGLLALLSSNTLEQIPLASRSPAGEWIGVSRRISSLVCNPKGGAPTMQPTSILDLAQPAWKGKIGISPADSDFPPIVGAMIAKFGKAKAEAWLAGMKRNAGIYEDEESVVSAVNRGSIACGIINQYYWYRLQLELGKKGMHSSLYYFPNGDPGSVVNVSGAAVLASSKNNADAEAFVDFLISEEGQKILAKGDTFEYPARPGVDPNPVLPPFDSLHHDAPTVASLGNDTESATLIEKAGLA